MMTSFNNILSVSLLVSSLVTVALCASGNTMVVLNKPASVNLIDCTPDNCQVRKSRCSKGRSSFTIHLKHTGEVSILGTKFTYA